MMEAFPFSAIVGQQEMKRCLILTAVDPTIGGVLVLGEEARASQQEVTNITIAKN